jgi:hypothetical protein
LCRYQYVDFIVNLLFHCPPPLPFAQPAALARLLSDQSQALLAAHRRIAEWERRSSQASRSWYALLRRAEAGEAKAGEVCVTPSPPLFLKFLLLYKYLMIVPLWWRRFFCLFQWLQFSSAFFFFFFFFFFFVVVVSHSQIKMTPHRVPLVAATRRASRDGGRTGYCSARAGDRRTPVAHDACDCRGEWRVGVRFFLLYIF